MSLSSKNKFNYLLIYCVLLASLSAFIFLCRGVAKNGGTRAGFRGVILHDVTPFMKVVPKSWRRLQKTFSPKPEWVVALKVSKDQKKRRTLPKNE